MAYYLAFSSAVFLFLFAIWTKRGWSNFICKLAFLFLGLAGAFYALKQFGAI